MTNFEKWKENLKPVCPNNEGFVDTNQHSETDTGKYNYEENDLDEFLKENPGYERGQRMITATTYVSKIVSQLDVRRNFICLDRNKTHLPMNIFVADPKWFNDKKLPVGFLFQLDTEIEPNLDRTLYMNIYGDYNENGCCKEGTLLETDYCSLRGFLQEFYTIMNALLNGRITVEEYYDQIFKYRNARTLKERIDCMIGFDKILEKNTMEEKTGQNMCEEAIEHYKKWKNSPERKYVKPISSDELNEGMGETKTTPRAKTEPDEEHGFYAVEVSPEIEKELNRNGEEQ